MFLLLLPALMQISHTLCSTHVVSCLLLLALHFYEQLNKLFVVGRVAATKLLDNCHKARDLAASVNCALHALCQQLKQAHTQPFFTVSNHPLSSVTDRHTTAWAGDHILRGISTLRSAQCGTLWWLQCSICLHVRLSWRAVSRGGCLGCGHHLLVARHTTAQPARFRSSGTKVSVIQNI